MSETLEQARARRHAQVLLADKEARFMSIEEALPELFKNVEVEEAKMDQIRRVIWYYDEFDDPFAQCVKDFIGEFGPGTTERLCGSLADLIRAYGRGKPISLSDEQDPPEIDEDLAKILMSIPRENIDRFQLEVANARQ